MYDFLCKLILRASTQGFAEQYNPETCERTEQQISMDLTTSHLKRVSQILKKIGEQTNMTVYFFHFFVELFVDIR